MSVHDIKNWLRGIPYVVTTVSVTVATIVVSELVSVMILVVRAVLTIVWSTSGWPCVVVTVF